MISKKKMEKSHTLKLEHDMIELDITESVEEILTPEPVK